MNIYKSLSLFGFILIVCCSCHHQSDKQKDKYAAYPAELGKLCREIDQDSDNPENYYLRALYYFNNGVTDSAFADIFSTLKIDTNQAKYYVLLSDLYFSQRETDLTEEMLQKALSKDAQYNEAHLKLAELYFFLKMYKEANVELDNALAINAYNPKAHLIRAYILKEQGHIEEAKRLLQLCIDQNPKEIKAFLELGYLYQIENNPICLQFYRNILNINPYNFDANYNTAMFYQEHEEYEKAMNQYKILLQADPNNKYALHNMGWIYMVVENKNKEAVAFFTKAIESDSTYVEAICNRGIAFENLKEYDKARQDFQYSCKLYENFEPAIKGLNRLDKIQ